MPHIVGQKLGKLQKPSTNLLSILGQNKKYQKIPKINLKPASVHGAENENISENSKFLPPVCYHSLGEIKQY